MDHDLRARGISAAAVAGLLLVLGAAVAFARADQTARVTADLADLRRTERVLSDMATFRADLAIAVVAATTEAETAVARRALDAADQALGRVDASIADMDDPDLAADVAVVRDGMPRIDELISDGDAAGADEVASRQILPALGELSDALRSSSARLGETIEAEQAGAGRLARTSSYTVALLVPGLALWAFRRSTRRRLERERLQAELIRQRDLTRAKDDLIAGLSHQLRTPLTGIHGFADSLLDAAAADHLDPSTIGESARIILDESNRLGRMVDDILVTARHDAASLSFDSSPVPVEAPVEAAVEAFRRAGHVIETDVQPAMVDSDALRLRHVIRNLVSNAVIHGNPPVTVTGIQDGDEYLITVEDSGTGIDPDREGRLYTPFVHTGRDATLTGSLGLGLYVVRTLVDGMGARVGHRRDGAATVFEISLPIARSEPDAESMPGLPVSTLHTFTAEIAPPGR